MQVAYREILSIIETADSGKRLRERWESEIRPLLISLKCPNDKGVKFKELMEARCGELEATA